MKISVHLYQKFSESWIAGLRSKLDKSIILTTGETLPESPDYQILIAGRPDKDFLMASPNLHTLIIPWSGLPRVTRKLLAEFPKLKVYNLHHNASPTAEMAITLMLAAARRLITIEQTFRKNDWRHMYDFDHGTIGTRPAHGPLLLCGKTALLIGYGAIGRNIGKVCSALGMKVRAIRRHGAGRTDSVIKCFTVEHLHRLLPKSNVLFICLPLTEKTKNLISAKELALLPDDAVIVNIARGAVIDEKALYEELASGRLRAGLDVWYNYPKRVKERSNTAPSNYPFHELENVVMTPHLGGHSDQTEYLRIEELAGLLNRAARGDDLPNPVDPKEGY